MEKDLSTYVSTLEKLFIKMISSSEEKNKEIDKRLDNLINLLVKNGIPPEEIEKILSLEEPYDPSLEQLKSDLVVEQLPDDLSDDSKLFQKFFDENFKEGMKEFFLNKHQEMKKFGIKFEEDYE